MMGEDENYYCDADEIKDYYNDDLTRKSDYKDKCQYDIVKIERAGQVIYEREETVEMTVSEIEKELGITGLRIKKED